MERLEERCLLDASSWTALDQLWLDPEDHSPDRILVRFRDKPFEIPETRIGEKLGSYHEVHLNSGLSISDTLAAYSADPRVLSAQPDYVVSISAIPNDTSFNLQWALRNTGQSGGVSGADINVPSAWDVTTGSGQVIVAVIDTGVDYNHPDLAANMWRNPGEVPGNGIDDDQNGYVDDVYGYDFANNDSNPMDDNGHGTHVAGTIGAVGNNSRGVAGVLWDVQIMALKFLGANGSGYISNALRALNYAVANGASISNNSWGGGGFDAAMLAAIQNARNAGHIFVAAAGNNARNNDTNPTYPSNYDVDNVVTVAALDRSDNLASFSNYGARTVDIGAPGVSILSTTPNNTYRTYSGTSMAAPHVTGVLALVRDLHPNWTYRQIIDQVLGTATPVSSLSDRTVTGGRVNAARAVGPSLLDSTPFRLTDATPITGKSGEVGAVRLTFSKPVDPATFTTQDVRHFVGPSGPISVLEISAVQGSAGRQFDVRFPTQFGAGSYSFVVGPDIRDTSGKLLNQDGDGFIGEQTQDQVLVTFTVQPLVVLDSLDVDKPLADLSRTVSVIDITEALRPKTMVVHIDLAHTYTGDLKITLVSPSGKKVPLVKRRGGSGDNFTDTIFDDQASLPIGAATAPFRGSFKPEKPLAKFLDKSAKGQWQLWIDDNALGDTGWLNSWSITFSTSSSTAEHYQEPDTQVQPSRDASRDNPEVLLLERSRKRPSRHLLFD